MEYKQLGLTGLEISAIGLGTMTWGLQNTQVEGFEQMDYAIEKGYYETTRPFDFAQTFEINWRACTSDLSKEPNVESSIPCVTS